MVVGNGFNFMFQRLTKKKDLFEHAIPALIVGGFFFYLFYIIVTPSYGLSRESLLVQPVYTNDGNKMVPFVVLVGSIASTQLSAADEDRRRSFIQITSSVTIAAANSSFTSFDVCLGTYTGFACDQSVTNDDVLVFLSTLTAINLTVFNEYGQGAIFARARDTLAGSVTVRGCNWYDTGDEADD